MSNFNADTKIKHNIKGLPKQAELKSMTFGRYIDEAKKIKAFIADEKTKSVGLSIKRQSVAKAFAEFKDLYEPAVFFARFHNGKNIKDDVFTVYYQTK